MNTKQFIRRFAARGLSRRATTQALDFGRWKFDLTIGAMGPIEWAKNGTAPGNRLAYEVSRGRFTPVQAAALERTHGRWSESRCFIVGGVTGMTAELVGYPQNPVHATTVRRRAVTGMSLRDTLITPCQQPKPGRWDPWKRSRQQVVPHLDEQIPESIKGPDSSTLCR